MDGSNPYQQEDRQRYQTISEIGHQSCAGRSCRLFGLPQQELPPFARHAMTWPNLQQNSMLGDRSMLGSQTTWFGFSNALYHDQVGTVRGSSGTSRPFDIRQGVRQGCVLSQRLCACVLQWALALMACDSEALWVRFRGWHGTTFGSTFCGRFTPFCRLQRKN